MSTASSGAQPSGTGMRLHAIDVWFENQPGALYRLLGVIGRHGGTVEQLVVAPSDTASVSRATLVVRAPDVRLMVRQMRRLLPVRAVAPPPDAVPFPASTLPTLTAWSDDGVSGAFTHPVFTHSEES